jgi:hypothetical protein
MLKSIKKSFKYLMILIGIIILVPTFFSLIFRIPDVQTFIIKRIAGHFSEQIKSTVMVGRIEYSFFNKLEINDLLIKDQNNDTLIYSQKISAGILRLDFRNKVIKLGHVEIAEPTVALITDTSGVMNLKWYLDMLGNSDNKGKKSNSNISINQITIKNGRFSLVNKTSPEAKTLIDFNNLFLSGINGAIDNIKVLNDSTAFRINELRLSESNGFLVRSMNSKVVLADHDIIFRDLFLFLSSSIISADHIIMAADSSDSFKRFTDEVRLDIMLQKSLISCTDLRFFLPSANGLDESAELSGKISGTIAELKGRNIRASYRDYSYLDCDFDLSGLPKFEDTFIHIGVNNLKTNAKDFEKIKKPDKNSLKIPEVLYKLGNISFVGSFTGFVTDFVTYGKIGTEVGNINTDISLRPEGKNIFKVKGLVKGIDVDLGQLADKSDFLGKMSMETDVDGFATSSKKISGNLTGRIDSIEINKYVYRNVALNGIFTEKTWDGSVKISDRNIKMDMLGMLDFSNVLPEFDFTLNIAEANLNKLNLDKADTTSHLAMLATANFRGNNIDNLFGEIKLLNSTLRKYNNKLDLYDFSLKAFNENNKPAISIRTDFVDADLRGYYEFGEIGNVMKTALSSLMPSKFKAPKPIKKQSKNRFTFSLNFKNTDKINKFFKTGILFAEKSSVNGAFYQDSVININANSKMFNYRNNIFSNLALNANYAGTKFTADLKSSSLSILGRSDLKGFKAGFGAVPDNFIFSFDWDNKDKILNKGDFIARGSYIKREDGKEGSLLKIVIDSTDVFTGNTPWKIRQSTIRVDSNSTQIDRFIVASRNNSYTIDGTISGNRDDTLSLTFKGIDLSPLSKPAKTAKEGKVSDIPFNLRGVVNGNILISSALKNPLIESNIRVNGFSILGGDYGDISVMSIWNSSRKVADINASNNLNGKKNIDIKGFYDPGIKNFNLAGTASNLPVDALNPLLSFFASGITGTVSGKVNLTGAPGELVLAGALMAENVSMKIDYLQTKYKVNDTIRFDKRGIKFKNIKITDEKGNYAVLTGSVFHKYFKDYSVDLTVNMDKNDCLVLNTQQKDNELFYGTAYATGVTTIKSGQNSLSFDISAKTGKGTKFYIPLNSSLTVSESSFVTFINPDTAGKEDEKKVQIAVAKPLVNAIELNFDLDVTPDAEVQLLIDPKAGDVIKGRGSGKLNLSYNKKGEFKIYGDYIIEQGDYLFTLKNILNKKFDVEDGGKITFNGDIYNAEIDLTAKYKNIKTPLYPILYPILQDEQYKARVPVEPQLNLSGNLFNPVVGLDIYLPNASEETRTYLRNAITTDEERSRQFIYLLVMNSFYSDPSNPAYQSPLSNTGTGTSMMAVTTTEMLSNQVSNWLSQISNDFNVGFNYRPGTKDINSQELQVALSTQLLNDKVTINGNFDVSGTGAAEQTPLIGDFDIEYKLTEKLRFKVFNRYNNPYTGKGVPYTQGLGLSFKQDFNKFSDLLKKKDSSEMKKEDDVTVVK